MNKNVSILDAPSNLGLRPPEVGSVPGCYKMPWALRDRGLLALLEAKDAGSLVPPRYRSQWAPDDGDRNAESIAHFSKELAVRTGNILNSGYFPLVLGGECSILIGNALALKKRGRYGLVYCDAHSDFRHPGNSEAIGAAGGEAMAIVTGRGDRRLINIDGLAPYIRDEDVVLLGIRATDEYLQELHEIGIYTLTSSDLQEMSLSNAAARVIESATQDTDGFWVHLDFDVVDSSEMQAVDCPEPNGLTFIHLSEVVESITASPYCIGMELTIYDPDLDPDGRQADAIIHFLENVFKADGSDY
jgi:arginase